MQPSERTLGPRSRSRDVRFIGGAVTGRYLLASRRRYASSAQVFACRLQSISPQTLVVSAPVLGECGEELTIHLHPFGILTGHIDRLVDGGFAAAINASDAQRIRLAKRIEWYKRRTYQGIEDKRRHKRFMPRDPRSLLIMGDGRIIECLIIDLSSSGAAVSADIRPAIGTPLAIGKAVARVVRPLDVGFAVRFVDEIAFERIEDMLHASPAVDGVAKWLA